MLRHPLPQRTPVLAGFDPSSSDPPLIRLTPYGRAAALTYRLNVAMEQVDDDVQDVILAGLADLVERHCPPLYRPGCTSADVAATY